MRMNRRLSDATMSFGTNELIAWHGYFRKKAGLPAPVVVSIIGAAGNSGSSGSVGGVFAPSQLTNTSTPSTGLTAGNGNRYCGGSKLSKICISGPGTWMPTSAPVASGGPWAQEAYLKAPNGDAGDSFGLRAFDISQETAIVGAPGESSNETTITNGLTASLDNSKAQSGAAYVFKRSGNIWSQEAFLKASNGDSGDLYGFRTNISGETAIVGAEAESSSQTTITNASTASLDNFKMQSGAVYVYRRTGINWSQEAYLKTSNSDASDLFGEKLSISGETIIAGVMNESSNQTTITNGTTASLDNSKGNSGAAYIFKRTGSNWSQEAFLKAPNSDPGDMFGASSSISGDTSIVGAYGEASNQTTITNGTTASSDNSKGTSGAAYIFIRTGSTWSQEAYLKASNSVASDIFGNSTSISGDTSIIGAYGDSSNQTTITNGTMASSDNSKVASGAAYIFKRTGSIWSQEAYLKTPNSDVGDNFGENTGISGDTAIAGVGYESSNQTTITNGTSASSDNSKAASGAAYLFKRTGNNWAQEAFLKASNSDAGDYFGNRNAAISEETSLVGAGGEASNQTTITNGTTSSANNSKNNCGAVYVYKRH